MAAAVDTRPTHCQSCGLDFSQSATLLCFKCDATSPFATGVEPECPRCGATSDVHIIPDDPMELCKTCLSLAMQDNDQEQANSSPTGPEEPAQISQSMRALELAETGRKVSKVTNTAAAATAASNPGLLRPSAGGRDPSCQFCGASDPDNPLLLVGHADGNNQPGDNLVGWCDRCDLKFGILEEGMACPMCSRPPDRVESLVEALQAVGVSPAPHHGAPAVFLCRVCDQISIFSEEAAAADVASEEAASSSEQPGHMKNLADEMWRFLGCHCDNHNPELFELKPNNCKGAKSHYCSACQLLYGANLWSEPLERDSCPGCQQKDCFTTDDIAIGDLAIVCLNCKSLISKSRFDRLQVELAAAEEASAGDQRRESIACLRCGRPGAVLELARRNEQLVMMQVCDSCHSAELIGDLSGVETSQLPPGFEELANFCCGLGNLHPVDDGEEEREGDLLVCGRHPDCMLSLGNCQNPRLPKTVKKLREALADTVFSTGEWGRPYGTTKMTRLEDLRPGDQLEFRRFFYTHHTIVVNTFPSEDLLAVIEYTGSSRTVAQKLVSAIPSKAQVANTLYRFQDIQTGLYRVEYRSLDCYPPRVAIQRAMQRLDEKEYHIGRGNCEHLCVWAKSGLDLSRQVDKFKATICKWLENPAMDTVEAVAGETLLSMVPASKTPIIVMEALRDVRSELLKLFHRKKGASNQVLRSLMRLALKWGIRSLPLLASMALEVPMTTVHLNLLVQFDSRMMKPLANRAADKLLPIEESEDDE